MKKILIVELLILAVLSLEISRQTFPIALADPIPCIQQKCPSQWANCQKDPKCEPALNDCYKKCGSKQSCWSLCLAGKGSQAAIDVAKCAASNGCVKMIPQPITTLMIADPIPCIQEKCPSQWANCQKDPKCEPAINDCYKKCGTSKSCWTFCLPGKGSQAATDVVKCAASNGCVSMIPQPITTLMIADPIPCIQQKCPSQWANCQKDPKCLPALNDCSKKCGTKQSCWSLCLAGKGSQAAIDVAKCAQANGCATMISQPVTQLMIADPLDCIKAKCPNQWANCQKDPKCEPALDDCNKKCGTNKNCWTLCIAGKNTTAVEVAKCGDKNNCLGNIQKKNQVIYQ